MPQGMVSSGCLGLALGALGALLAGCAAPSTLLVNDQMQVARCAAYGSGAMGIATADVIHRRCVEDYKKLGYVAVPDVVLGVNYVPGSLEVREVLPGSGAAQAGITVGDRILRIDEQPTQRPTEVFRTLAGKQRGETVQILLDRGGETLSVPVTLTQRGE